MNWIYLAYASLWLRKGYFETRLLKDDILVKGEALKAPPTNISNETESHFFLYTRKLTMVCLSQTKTNRIDHKLQTPILELDPVERSTCTLWDYFENECLEINLVSAKAKQGGGVNRTFCLRQTESQGFTGPVLAWPEWAIMYHCVPLNGKKPEPMCIRGPLQLEIWNATQSPCSL